METDTVNATIVTSGEKWVGFGYRSIYSVTDELIGEAEKSILMTAYLLSDSRIVERLRSALERDVYVEIFLNHQQNNEVSQAMEYILQFVNMYQNINLTVLSREMLHAKVMVIDYSRVLISSANLTFSGMTLNYEMGILIDDQSMASDVIKLLRRLRV
ncbi:MAG: phospholipase D-like domain-containing protein [Thermoplasmata archaeon]